MDNPYLIAAYTFVAVVFVLYAWSLSLRKARLGKDLEDLRSRLARPSPPAHSSS